MGQTIDILTAKNKKRRQDGTNNKQQDSYRRAHGSQENVQMYEKYNNRRGFVYKSKHFHNFSIITTRNDYNTNYAVIMNKYYYNDDKKHKSTTPPNDNDSYDSCVTNITMTGGS
eukprot:3957962-Amphidinium_carterae.1